MSGKWAWLEAAALIVLLSSMGQAQEMAMPVRVGAPFHVDMMNSMAKMDRDMQRAPMTGNPDHDFAAMMIPHHQGAIDMARAELLYGKDPVLRRLAQEIITTQNSEIQLMRQRLATLPAGRKVARGEAP